MSKEDVFKNIKGGKGESIREKQLLKATYEEVTKKPEDEKTFDEQWREAQERRRFERDQKMAYREHDKWLKEQRRLQFLKQKHAAKIKRQQQQKLKQEAGWQAPFYKMAANIKKAKTKSRGGGRRRTPTRYRAPSKTATKREVITQSRMPTCSTGAPQVVIYTNSSPKNNIDPLNVKKKKKKQKKKEEYTL